MFYTWILYNVTNQCHLDKKIINLKKKSWLPLLGILRMAGFKGSNNVNSLMRECSHLSLPPSLPSSYSSSSLLTSVSALLVPALRQALCHVAGKKASGCHCCLFSPLSCLSINRLFLLVFMYQFQKTLLVLFGSCGHPWTSHCIQWVARIWFTQTGSHAHTSG